MSLKEGRLWKCERQNSKNDTKRRSPLCNFLPYEYNGTPFCSVTLHGNREFADVIKVINHLTLKWRTLVWARCNHMIPLKAKMFLWLMAEEVREIPNVRITEHTMAHVKMKGHVMRKECSRTWQPTMNQFLQKPEWTWDPILPLQCLLIPSQAHRDFWSTKW